MRIQSASDEIEDGESNGLLGGYAEQPWQKPPIQAANSAGAVDPRQAAQRRPLCVCVCVCVCVHVCVRVFVRACVRERVANRGGVWSV